MATSTDLYSWFVGLNSTDRIATGAMVIAGLALIVSILAARYSGSQAKVARRQDLRLQIRDMESDLIVLRQVENDLRTGVATATSMIEMFVQQIGRPQSQRLGPPSERFVLTAHTVARKDAIAGIALLEPEREAFRQIAADDDAVHDALIILREACDIHGQQAPEVHEARRAAVRAVTLLEGHIGPARAAARRIKPLAEAEIVRMERKLR